MCYQTVSKMEQIVVWRTYASSNPGCGQSPHLGRAHKSFHEDSRNYHALREAAIYSHVAAILFDAVWKEGRRESNWESFSALVENRSAGYTQDLRSDMCGG